MSADACLQASEHAFAVHGLVAFYRDVAEAIHKAGDAETPVCSGDLSVWVLKLDTLTNLLANSCDDLSDALRKSEINAPLAWGSFVGRGNA